MIIRENMGHGELGRAGWEEWGRKMKKYGLYCVASTEYFTRVSNISLYPPTTQQHEIGIIIGIITSIFMEENSRTIKG